MAGYIRQDVTNNIADGNVINAADFDLEYDAIEAAFHATTGHTHDGTAAEGAPITKIGPTQDVVVSASSVTPKTDNTVDLGSAALEFKDLYIDGIANIDSLIADTVDINAGTIDGVTIGASTPSTGSFTTLAASSTTTLSGLTASTALALNSSKEVVSVTNTGTGNNVLASSPVLVTPNIGTPSAATLTNATGLPVSTGISGLGTGVATFLTTPSSSNLAAAITDETGTGALVFSSSPTFSGTTTFSNTTVNGTATFTTVVPTANTVDSVGYTGMPANIQSANYTTVASDAGKTILHPATDNNSRTFTIPSNASVPYPVGTCITFINTVNTVTIAITSDTMYMYFSGSAITGSRTLDAYGIATAIKVGTTSWLISGNGLT